MSLQTLQVLFRAARSSKDLLPPLGLLPLQAIHQRTSGAPKRHLSLFGSEPENPLHPQKPAIPPPTQYGRIPFPMASSEVKVTKAAACIIGDEILNGKIQDSNTFYLAQVLFEVGIELVRVETIPDDIDDIVETVQRMSGKYDLVFTSGGIGPTHDDKTYEAIAKAFGRQLEYHQPTLDKMDAYYKSIKETTMEDARRMALFPTGSKIMELPNLFVPLVICENVHILPGVPKLFKAMVNRLKPQLQTERKKKRVLVYTELHEVKIATILREAQEKFTQVGIGSYPRFDEYPPTMISVEGWDHKAVDDCVASFITKIEGFTDVNPKKRTRSASKY